MEVCTVPDCDRPQNARGWCKMHWKRWRRNGDPSARQRVPHGPEVICAVDGCDRPAVGRLWCAMHYQRWKKHGDPTFRLRNGAPVQNSTGYLLLCRSEHVLADKAGFVYQHRFVLFDQIGYGPHRCHWCGSHVNWFRTRRPERLDVDHLDRDKKNNDPANLVPSCTSCNSRRVKKDAKCRS